MQCIKNHKTRVKTPAHVFTPKLHTITTHIFVVPSNIPKTTRPPTSHSTQHQQFPPAVTTVSSCRENPKQFSDYIALSQSKLLSTFQFPRVELSQLSCACVENNASASVFFLWKIVVLSTSALVRQLDFGHALRIFQLNQKQSQTEWFSFD